MSIHPKISRAVATICIIAIVISSVPFIPQRAEAQGINVPIGTTFNFHSIMDNLKNFTLDRLAVMVANQILQKMTASVVNWINTGFEGSPMFLTDPAGFFLDVGDQITGQFLHEIGVPGMICDPFSLDIRLNLALNQAGYRESRYTCTLGTIIRNTQEAIDRGVSVTVDTTNPNGLRLNDLVNPSDANFLNNPDIVSVNNASMKEFMRGDFRYGGWPGFLAMSMQPQNNPNMAYIQAEADLQNRIAERRSQVNNDLNRGGGFLSWESCKDVAAPTSSLGLSAEQNSQLRQFGQQSVDTGPTDLGNSTRIRKKVDSTTGLVKYQDCQTQTPGSIIGGSLQRQLNVPQDKLVLVKTISDAIDNILGALVNQMLTQGLAALSNRSSGGSSGQSYLRVLSAEADARNSSDVQLINLRTSSMANGLSNLALTTMTAYNNSISILTDSKNRFITARTCFETKLASPLLESFFNTTPVAKTAGQTQISIINSIISLRIDPMIASFTTKKQAVEGQFADFNSSLTAFSSTTTTGTSTAAFAENDINERWNRLEAVVGSSARAARTGSEAASASNQEYVQAQAASAAFNTEAEKKQLLCDGFPYNVPVTNTVDSPYNAQ